MDYKRALRLSAYGTRARLLFDGLFTRILNTQNIPHGIQAGGLSFQPQGGL